MSHALDPARRAEIVDHAATCASCHAVIADVAGEPATVASVDPHGETRSPDEEPAAVRRLIANALVAHGSRNKIGRYHLLEIVGAGGMGVVWGAWDPELARRVALKLVHPRIGAARDRILAEGQALGKLSHPNVVPVYDVGVLDEQVYLVMEWVQGTTLRAYAASPCSQRDLVEAYRQAGEGLAAAHRAGLVHRDFKPDNAIRGDDGRVRVLDFGLARSDDESAEPVKRLAGTPRYMPPEQATGGVVTPAADQYAFALSLREALTRTVNGRELEPPSWLAGILARGTARDPADRFASMQDLLRALARDPATVWRRRGIALAAAGAAVAAFVVGRAQTDAAPTCVGSAAEIARSWNPTMRAAIAAHLHGLGAFGAGEADRLGDELDRYSAAWASEHHRACVAHERGELTATLYERRIGCLARGQAALTTVAELMASVGTAGLPSALVAARSLPSAAGCTAADTSTVPPPPEAVAMQVAAVRLSVERARVLVVAGTADAATVAKASVAAAERTAYQPLIARALLAQGRAEIALNAGEDDSRNSLERAVDLALRNGDDVLAVEAYARLLYAVSRYRGDVVNNWSVMEAIASRTGPLGRFARTLLYNNKAIARQAADDPAGARVLLQQAIAASPIDLFSGTATRPLADDEVELMSVAYNVVLVTDDPAERETKIRQVIAQREAVLGARHPSTLAARFNAGTLIRNPTAAAEAFQAAWDGYQRWHPQRTVEIVNSAFERAWIADERGDTATALAAMRVAATDPLSPREREKGTIAAKYLELAGDEAEAAIAVMQERGAALAKATQSWTRGEGADAYITAALGWDRLSRPRDAERCWAAALALLEEANRPIFDRRLARARATLARRWAATRPDDARRLATAALDWYRGAGGYDAEVAALAPIAR